MSAYPTPLFSSGTLYKAGDRCEYNGKIYVLGIPILLAENFDEKDWYELPSVMIMEDYSDIFRQCRHHSH